MLYNIADVIAENRCPQASHFHMTEFVRKTSVNSKIAIGRHHSTISLPYETRHVFIKSVVSLKLSPLCCSAEHHWKVHHVCSVTAHCFTPPSSAPLTRLHRSPPPINLMFNRQLVPPVPSRQPADNHASCTSPPAKNLLTYTRH